MKQEDLPCLVNAGRILLEGVCYIGIICLVLYFVSDI